MNLYDVMLIGLKRIDLHTQCESIDPLHARSLILSPSDVMDDL